MNKIFLFIGLTVVLLTFSACFSPAEPTCRKECKKDGENLPLWICSPKASGKIVVVSSSKKSPAGSGFQRAMASANSVAMIIDKIVNRARKKLMKAGIEPGEMKESLVSGKKFLAEVVRDHIKHLKVWDKTKDGTLYLMVGIPHKVFNTYVEDVIKRLLSFNKSDYDKYYKNKKH